MKLYYEQNYRLRTNDFDCFDTVTPTSILDSYQDVAGLHAYMLGLGYEQMYNKGYYWVILRQKVKVIKSPKPGDVLHVATWPLPKNRLEFKREYKIYNQYNELISYSSSVWVLINTSDRRISRARDIDYDGEFVLDEYFIDLKKIEDISEFNNVYNYEVKFADLDHNKHMNNSKYLEVILNILNYKTKTLVEEFQLDYMHEVKLGEVLTIKEFMFENIRYYYIYRDDLLVTKAKIVLREE